MIPPALPKCLPTLLATLHQEGLDGELELEQNDGIRRLYWRGGELVYLQSDAAGEQFGNYLLRQGILDFPALTKLLGNDERSRLGDKVIQYGLMTLEERDAHLRMLQEQVMVNALEHAIVQVAWNPGSLMVKLSEDLQLKLDHRHFIWAAFAEAHLSRETLRFLDTQSDWKWEGSLNLLESLSDLPLNPGTAYALSFLGPEPVGLETFLSLSNLPEETAIQIILSLWAIGALTLTQGQLPGLTPRPAPAQGYVPLPAPVYHRPPPPGTAAQSAPFTDRRKQPAPFIERRNQPDPPEARRAVPAPEPEQEPVPEFVAEPDQPYRSLAEGPSSHARARTLYRKAKHLQLLDHTGEAIRCLEQAVQLDPTSTEAYDVWLLLGRLRISNPAWSTRAVDALQTAAGMRPKAAEPWLIMGELYYRKGFRTHAAGCYRKALELDPAVDIPPEVDLTILETEGDPDHSQTASLFSRFRSILGGQGKA